MASPPRTSQDEITVRLLEPDDGPAAWRLLSRGGVRDVYLASQVWGGGLSQRDREGAPEFHGAFRGRALCGLAYLGSGGLAIPAATDPEVIAALGSAVASRGPELRALIGDETAVAILRPLLEEAGVRAYRDFRERLYEAGPSSLAEDAREPRLQPAALGDLELVVGASSEAHREEMGDEPSLQGPTAFVGRVARMIMDDRIWLLREGATLVFKAEVSALSPAGAQISGVYTHPDHRGLGHARRGTGELARRLFEETSRVCLYVRHDNEAAIRAYERAGFRFRADFRTLFLELRPRSRRG